jgi:hypothetical protein
MYGYVKELKQTDDKQMAERLNMWICSWLCVEMWESKWVSFLNWWMVGWMDVFVDDG